MIYKLTHHGTEEMALSCSRPSFSMGVYRHVDEKDGYLERNLPTLFKNGFV